ncbi:MAG: PAS domain S-box protein [Deltaproteobacteria bacterium]|nr:PAS domain S-box protein [Deltaproteobacteria bacterium]
MPGKPGFEELERMFKDLERKAEKTRTAEKTLMENEKRLSQIIEASPTPTFVIDKSHTLSHCNTSFEKLIGVTRQEIAEKRCTWFNEDSREIPYMADFIVDHAPDEEMAWYYGGKCRKSDIADGAYEVEAFFPKLGEHGSWLFLTAAPLKDGDGNIIGAVETLQDVTERRLTEEALRESEKRLSQIVQGSSIPTFVINKQHIMTHCNRAYENLTKIPANAVIGTDAYWLTFYRNKRPVLADFIVDGAPEEEVSAYYGDKFRRSEAIDGAYEAEGYFPELGDRGKWLFFTAAPIIDDDGNITGAIETLQDVTDRKKSEQALMESEKRYRTLLDFAPYPIIVFTLDGIVSYLNPAFTETFGWTFSELEGKKLNYIPPGEEKEEDGDLQDVYEKKVILKRETRRMTKDGRKLDVILRTVVFSVSEDQPEGTLVILRDVTNEKRIAQINEAMLRISMALPEYPDLEDLLYYVNNEVKRLIGTEGAIVVLHDEVKRDLFIQGAAYDDMDTERRTREVRFPMDGLIAGEVIRTGQPKIISDTSGNKELHRERDRRLGYRTRNVALVPLKSSDRVFGALCATNKKDGNFDEGDVELLSIIAGTVALSVENARFSEEIKQAYREVTSLNRAKDKVINHLSHEMKTPVSILSASLALLAKRISSLPENTWKPTMERLKRNLDRIVAIQYQVHDIMDNDHYEAQDVLTTMIEVCADEIETLLAEEVGEKPVVQAVRRRVDEIFGLKQAVSEPISLDRTVEERLKYLIPLFLHREVRIILSIEPVPPIFLPPDVLEKVIDGLVKNAVENTPDEGRIEVNVRKKGQGAELVVRDYGVGIPEEAQKRIFEGFFTTRDTMRYSSKRPFDFNAGGKGADLLRMKIFSERYNFRLDMVSKRCPFIPSGSDLCPGRVSKCPFCAGDKGCHDSAATTFTVSFLPAPESQV